MFGTLGVHVQGSRRARMSAGECMKAGRARDHMLGVHDHALGAWSSASRHVQRL